MTITYKQIRDRIESSAKEIVGEIDFPKESTIDAWEEYQSELEDLRDSESYDKAHEYVDSWDWCIYTYKGFQVYDALSLSERNDAEQAFEDAGGYYQAIDQQMGPYEMGCAMASYWLVQALVEEIQSQCDDLLELVENKLNSFS